VEYKCFNLTECPEDRKEEGLKYAEANESLTAMRFPLRWVWMVNQKSGNGQFGTVDTAVWEKLREKKSGELEENEWGVVCP